MGNRVNQVKQSVGSHPIQYPEENFKASMAEKVEAKERTIGRKNLSLSTLLEEHGFQLPEVSMSVKCIPCSTCYPIT